MSQNTVLLNAGVIELTTKGDLLTWDTANVRLAIGTTDGMHLVVDSTEPTGMKWVVPTGGGDVVKVGTPVNNQIGVWTGDGTIEGGTGLTFDGTDLTLGGSLKVTDAIVFTPQANPSYAAGELVYDSTNESLTFFNNESDIGLQIGQENWTRVRNASGSTITNGQAVYISGNHAGTGLPQISLAKADVESTSKSIGIVTHDIENNSTGFVTVGGSVGSLNTSSFSNGDELFLSASVAGGLTATAPSSPNFIKSVGFVTKSNATTGTILIVSSGLVFHVSLEDVRVVGNTFAGNVNYDGNEIENIAIVAFDLTAGASVTQGQFAWNADEETLDLGLNGAVLQLGQETHYHVRNLTGSTITDGTAVMAIGTLGASGRILIGKMVGSDIANAKFFLGIATEDIATGTDGKVTSFGKVRGVDTDSWNEGDVLWVDNSTPGDLTNTEPTTGTKLPIAFVVTKHAVNGVIAVRSTDGTYFAEAHDVTFTSVASGEIIKYDGAKWINNTLAEAGVAAASHTHLIADVTDFTDNSTTWDALVTNVTTNLTFSRTATTVTVISSDGTNAVLPEANTTNAGVLGSDKWDEIVANTAKSTNVNTDLSMGTVSGTQYTINSSDGNNVNLPLADTNNWGIISDEIFDDIVANTAKTSNVSTSLSTGTVTATTYGITSDGGANDVVLVEATTTVAGLLGADKWDEIVANTAKTSNVTHTGQVTGSTTLTVVVAAITGQVALTTGLAAADELLVSDGGVIKRMDISVMNAYFNANLTFGSGDGIVESLTTTGTSGAATLGSGVLNIPNYADTIYTHPNHSGHITSTGDGDTVLVVAAITGQTALTTGLVGGDELLVSDGGIIKRMDISVMNAYFDANLGFSTTVGTVTSVTAGTGMTQTGTSTINPTLNVIAGAGLTANANDIILDLSNVNAWTGQQYFAAQLETTSGTTDNVAWNLNTEQTKIVTLDNTTVCTIDNPTNMKSGGTYIMIFKQGSTANTTIAWGTAYDFPGGTAASVTAAANSVDIMTFVSDGTTMFCVEQKNFS